MLTDMDRHDAESAPEFSTIPDAARLLGVGPAKIRAAIKAGDLPAYRIGAWPRVDVAEVRSWIRAQRVAPSNRAAEKARDWPDFAAAPGGSG